MKRCKDCPHFEIRSEYESIYNWGEAVCKKHNLITDFRSKKKVETLCCIEEEEQLNGRYDKPAGGD